MNRGSAFHGGTFLQSGFRRKTFAPGRRPRSFTSRIALFVFLLSLLFLPVYHLQAGNLSTVSPYQQLLMVQASARYLKSLSSQLTGLEIASLRTAILEAAKNQRPKAENLVYVPVSRPPEKEKLADPAFFNGAAFLGDSITEGLSLSGPTDGVTVLAAKGMTIKKAASEISKLVSSCPKRVYILLGINDMTNYNVPLEHHIESYRALLSALTEELPDASLYVQSVFPIAARYDNGKTKLTNEKITQFNEMLSLLCKELGLRYIDLCASLADTEGCLTDFLTSDGLHLKAAYYPFWLNLLMENSQ